MVQSKSNSQSEKHIYTVVSGMIHRHRLWYNLYIQSAGDFSHELVCSLSLSRLQPRTCLLSRASPAFGIYCIYSAPETLVTNLSALSLSLDCSHELVYSRERVPPFWHILLYWVLFLLAFEIEAPKKEPSLCVGGVSKETSLGVGGVL